VTIHGYPDKLSVEPGQNVKFMINSEGNENYQAEIVRLIHGDTNPDGPGWKVESIDTDLKKQYRGREQKIYSGSYVAVPDNSLFRDIESFSLQAMIWPTTPDKGIQGLVTKWSDSKKAGYGLFIDESGYLSFWIGDGSGKMEKVSTGKKLVERCWFFVGASFDASNGTVEIFQQPLVDKANGRFSLPYSLETMTAHVKQVIKLKPDTDHEAPFIMAGYLETIVEGKSIVGGLYNGKIDRPRMADRVLTRQEMEQCIENPFVDLLAVWDFAANIGPKGLEISSKIIDKSQNELHGKATNLPTRAMTGYNWTSNEQNFIHAPEQYGAIHFHDDDLSDADWKVDFEFTIPDDLRSGVYAAHVKAGEDEDYVTFFVRPKKGTATAKIALLIPTASYLAYANTRFQDVPLAQLMFGRAPVIQAEDLYLMEHKEYGLSTYDVHSDGSGVCYSSGLRPILNMRPKYRHNLSPSLWQFNADLHLVDWLTEKGYTFDVITDHDLNEEGVDLLKPYNVVLTGSHPEYYSGAMLDAVEDYQQLGGRFMYMGANGFYWIIQFNPENPNIIEVRKQFGSNAWKANPGELHLSFSGEQGGLWRNRGRAPQKIAGTGFIAEGFDVSSYYRRNPDSFDPRVSWIFEGIGEDELIGNFGLVGGGAAGLEVDTYDLELGTPPETLILASSEGHSNAYMQVVEELYFNVPSMGGAENPRVRADIVYYPTPKGGAVFSVSSIAYCGSLSHNNYENNISQLTNNVLQKFMSDEPLHWEEKSPQIAGTKSNKN
jgi:N,N-dimethylformamidase